MNLKGYRASKDLSQDDVAEYLGICKNAYRDREKGNTMISLEEGVKLARLYEVTLEEIYQAVKQTFRG